MGVESCPRQISCSWSNTVFGRYHFNAGLKIGKLGADERIDAQAQPRNLRLTHFDTNCARIYQTRSGLIKQGINPYTLAVRSLLHPAIIVPRSCQRAEGLRQTRHSRLPSRAGELAKREGLVKT